MKLISGEVYILRKWREFTRSKCAIGCSCWYCWLWLLAFKTSKLHIMAIILIPNTWYSAKMLWPKISFKTNSHSRMEIDIHALWPSQVIMKLYDFTSQNEQDFVPIEKQYLRKYSRFPFHLSKLHSIGRFSKKGL